MEIDQIKSITADELAVIQKQEKNIAILDVRKASEYKSEHIKGTINAPLDFINDSMAAIQKDKTFLLCTLK